MFDVEEDFKMEASADKESGISRQTTADTRQQSGAEDSSGDISAGSIAIEGRSDSTAASSIAKLVKKPLKSVVISDVISEANLGFMSLTDRDPASAVEFMSADDLSSEEEKELIKKKKTRRRQRRRGTSLIDKAAKVKQENEEPKLGTESGDSSAAQRLSSTPQILSTETTPPTHNYVLPGGSGHADPGYTMHETGGYPIQMPESYMQDPRFKAVHHVNSYQPEAELGSFRWQEDRWDASDRGCIPYYSYSRSPGACGQAARPMWEEISAAGQIWAEPPTAFSPAHFSAAARPPPQSLRTEQLTVFCPYCGSRCGVDFKFCRSCGRSQPDSEVHTSFQL